MLNVERLSFRYRNGPPVLHEVSFSLEAGEMLAVLGNNGAGKSTLLKCLCRILSPHGGRVTLDGEDLLSLPHREGARRTAFVAQTAPETEMTVHDVVMLGRRPYMGWSYTEGDHEIVHQAMDRLGLAPLRGRFLSQLSGGERQKVMLARALAQQPRLLLLDEPTSNLDIRNQYHVLELVRDICRAGDLAAVLVIHDLNLALRFCDKLLLLRDGRVYRWGHPGILDRQALEEVYHVRGQVAEVAGRSMVLID